MNNISRRAWLGGIGIAAARTVLGYDRNGAQTNAGPRSTPLVSDLAFERGLVVWKPAPGQKVVCGTIQPAGVAEAPVWGLSQWYSHFDLTTAPPERLASGSTRFSNPGMAVTFGRAGTAEADLILALNGPAEYGDRAPALGEAWPSLLVEQSLRPRAHLKALRAVPFHISYRLLKSNAFHFKGWDPYRHTAQFTLYLTVENGNDRSPGFRDYFWFGVPLYDARYRLPPLYAKVDFSTPQKQSTGKFIFNPGLARYITQSAHDGEWVTIDKDLLPLINEGLPVAWHAGFLQGSHNPADYLLGELNLGWEVTGPLDAAMQLRGFRLEMDGR